MATAQELFEQMAAKAGWTLEQVKLALDTPEGKELSNGYVRHAEYSSALDKARNLDEKAKRAEAWDKWWGENQQKLTTIQTEHAAYKARLQELGYTDAQAQAGADAAARQAGAVAGLTAADVQKMLEQQALSVSSVMRDIAVITSTHDSSRLGKLDFSEVEKIAQEKQLSLKQAYDTLMQPKVRELEAKELDERIKREREEAVKDYATRHNLPVSPATAHSPVPFDFTPKTGDNAPKPMADADLVAMWNDAGKTAA